MSLIGFAAGIGRQLLKKSLRNALGATLSAHEAHYAGDHVAQTVGQQQQQQRRGKMWSVERESGHTYRNPDEIIDDNLINRCLDETKQRASDPAAVRAILEAAQERTLLKNHEPGPSEYVQGLTYEECATLLNVDANNTQLMDMIYETAFAIKNRIYGNRIVLFAPLYIANWCVNNCKYCAFRAQNKGIMRTMLTDDDIRAEVAALQEQGHRRILALTGEHPKYTFEQFLNALDIISSVESTS